MITIHHEKETDFSKNGYGNIDEFIFNQQVRWVMNGEFNVTFEYPMYLDNSKQLINRNILRVPVPFMQDQLFRIARITKVLGFIEVEAHHIFYDLLDNLVEDTFIVGQSGQSAIQQLLRSTQYPHRFEGLSNIQTSTNARIVRYNPVEALLDDGKANSFVSRWGGEILRDNFRINMMTQLGSNRGVHIEHKKDLLGYEASIDETTVVTRIYPRGFDGLELPERYIDSPIIDNEHPKIRIIDYEVKAAIGEYANDEDAIPLEEAYKLLREYAREEYTIHHVDEPEMVVNVDFITLNNTLEYSDLAQLQEVRQGDTVKVSVPEENFSVTSRLVEYTSDPLQKNHYLSTTLGNHVLEFTSSESNIEDIRKELNTIQEEIISVRQSANGKTRVFNVSKNPNELDLKAQVGDLAYQNNGDETIMWLLVEVNGEKYWKEIGNTADIDKVKREVEAVIEEAEIDRKNTQEAIEQVLVDAEQYTDQKSQEFEIEFNSELDKVRNIAVTAPRQIEDAIQRAGFGGTLADLTDRIIQQSNTADQTAREAYNKAIDSFNETGKLDTKINGVDQKVDEVNGSIRNRVWQTDITNAIGEIDNGTRNILTAKDLPTSLQIKTLEKFKAKFWATGLYSNSWVKENLNPNTTYTIRYKAKLINKPTTPQNNPWATITINLYSESRGSFVLGSVDWSRYASMVVGDEIEVVKTVTLPSYVHDMRILAYCPRHDPGTIAEIEFSELKLVKGNTTSKDWEPSPADTSNAISTVQTEMEQTAERFSQSIIRVESTLDGKIETKAFNTLQSDVDRTINRIGTAEGRLNTIESTANGTLQTVSGPGGLSTQVATLSNGFSILSKQTVQNLVTTGDDGRALHSIWSRGAEVSLASTAGDGFVVTQSVNNPNMTGSNRIFLPPAMTNMANGKIYTIILEINADRFTEIAIGQTSGNNIKETCTSEAKRITFSYESNSTNSFSIFFLRAASYRIRFVSVVEGGGASQGQLSVLKDQIDLAVTEGDVVGRINIQAGRTLIQNKQIVMDAETTYFTGKAFIPDAAILELKANKIFGTEGDFVTLRSKVLIANTISAVHIKSDTAMIDKLFATTALIDRLTSKQAFISSIKAIDISADNITTGTLNGAQLNIINMNARAISTGTITGANSSWNLNNGRISVTNPSTGNTLTLTQGSILFNRNNYSMSLEYTTEGLVIAPGMGNTGTGANASIYLNGVGNSSYKYIHFQDRGSNNSTQRIQAIDNHMDLMPATGGRVRVMTYGTNNYASIEASLFYTNHVSGNTLRLIGDRLETPRSGTRDIYISPNGQGAVRISNTNGDFYNIRASNFLVSSSRKLKTNIRPADVDALSIINGLKVVNYYLIKDLKDGIEHTQIGLIAEDSRIVASLEGDSIDGYKVDAYLIKAVQEVDNKVINLKEHVMSEFERIAYDNLQRDIEIKKLKKRLDLLEGAA
ncbi:phage tail spike protein [Marinilactibacillus sp. GCM10026970]|uniref:phage tail spike protein n=1 Tax=Marinilactibacillus sp. GCM10026970 TaxID=3252642 RepID=UPI003613D3F8